MSDQLRAALAGALADARSRDVKPAVRRLIAGYRSGDLAGTPILDQPEAVRAYAAYRMPATYAALSEVFAQLPLPGLEPRTMLDLGGGTGGTPAGYQRVLAAREALIEAGWRVLAPCPHSMDCPLAGGPDWCHFAARLERSALHRQAKGGQLGHEDEKFAYVVATRETPGETPGGAPASPAGGPVDGRVLRHPVARKGLVSLTVCARDNGVIRTQVAKSHPLYRAARATRWGSPWPPAESAR